ncbi:MAG TPA: hypothetical protein VER55_09905 [Ardenticatenaceae bacterium]|nr:hypothetical protein [Ardenticatenaceae bacterium]
MHEVVAKLAGGDRRSIGRVDEVVADVLNERALFGVVFDGMLGDDPVVRMRSADAIEKISAKRPEYLQPFKEQLLNQVARIEQQEVRWHVAQMFPRLTVHHDERAAMVTILCGYLDDRSKIVQTFSLQALADLAEHDPQLRGQVIALIEERMPAGSPAVRSRGARLLERLRGASDQG